MGQWAGKLIRADLEEIQAADRGRKYAEVDRRALDPPPVVALRLFEVTQTGEYYEAPYESNATLGLLCSVELIPAAKPSHSPQRESSSRVPTCVPDYAFQEATCSAYSSRDLLCHNSNLYERHYSTPEDLPSPEEVTGDVSPVGDIPCPEVARLTDQVLVGSKVVEPRLFTLDQQKVLLFIFPDLAVKKLGYFRLRYKFFSLTACIPGISDKVVQAECLGDVFRVYSTKDFPGLEKSTKLTRMLSLQGASLNIRNSEPRRKRKRKYGVEKDERTPPFTVGRW